MKFILPLLFVSLILAACAPAPQVTVTPEATITSTPLPTETPLPTLTPTPVAVDGIAEDAEGNKLAYLNGEWLTLTNLPSDGDLKLKVDGEKVVAVDADGEIAFEYDMATGSWVEVEKTYPSCAMPELIAEQDAGFTERTGIDLNDAEHPFIEAINAMTHVGWRPETGDIISFSVVKTGYAEVAMNHPEIDRMVCLYGRNGVVPGETMAFVMGWMDKSGNFNPLTLISDSFTGQDLSRPWPLRGGEMIFPDGQLNFMKNIPDGAVFNFEAHTFGGRDSVGEVPSNWTFDNTNLNGVRELLELLGGDAMVKQWGEAGKGNVAEYWRNLSPDGGYGFLIIA